MWKSASGCRPGDPSQPSHKAKNWDHPQKCYSFVAKAFSSLTISTAAGKGELPSHEIFQVAAREQFYPPLTPITLPNNFCARGAGTVQCGGGR